MHSKSDDKEIKINDKADEVFKSLLNRYQNNLETSMRGSDFIFDCVHLLYYKLQTNKSESWIISRFSSLDNKQKINNKPYK